MNHFAFRVLGRPDGTVRPIEQTRQAVGDFLGNLCSDLSLLAITHSVLDVQVMGPTPTNADGSGPVRYMIAVTVEAQ